MDTVQSIETIIKDLKLDLIKLSDFELYSLAIQIQRNQILKSGLAVYSNDKYPPALEAIARSLGFRPEDSQDMGVYEIHGTINDLSDSLAKVSETLDYLKLIARRFEKEHLD